ncbi:quinone oxidoreductase family protein [Bradyrhizobium liaoningense]
MGLVDLELPEPAPGQVLVQHAAMGVNYIDVYQRDGTYPVNLPSGLGHEAAGTVVAVGDGVNDLRSGDRIVYPSAGLGAYAEARIVPADRVVKLPDQISFETAAAVIFKGLTAWYLSHRTKNLTAEDVVVVHSAAGGVGQILAAFAAARGAYVIGTVGKPAKRVKAEAVGCSAVLVRGEHRLADFVAAQTGGRKASVVYDAIGFDTFEESLEALAAFGLMVSYGAASGPVPPMDLSILGRKGSLYLTRPSVFSHIAQREDLLEGCRAVFDAVDGCLMQGGVVSFPMSQAAEAHRLIQSGSSTGSIVLTPP